jgi:NADPH:quinone reductase-like Zn-dependent oxidoreductase
MKITVSLTGNSPAVTLNLPRRPLIHGAAGSVGAFAVQPASRIGAEVIATGRTKDADRIRALGAAQFIESQESNFVEAASEVDVVIDTVGGDVLDRSFTVPEAGGVLALAVAVPDQQRATRLGVKAVFMLVTITVEGLGRLATLFDAGELKTNVGEIMALEPAWTAHEMLAGNSDQSGKIMLRVLG